jgi:hypothetical protein
MLVGFVMVWLGAIAGIAGASKRQIKKGEGQVESSLVKGFLQWSGQPRSTRGAGNLPIVSDFSNMSASCQHLGDVAQEFCGIASLSAAGSGFRVVQTPIVRE